VRSVNMRHVRTWLQTSSTVKSKNRPWDTFHSNGIKHNATTLCVQHVNNFLGQHLPWDLPPNTSERCYCYATRLVICCDNSTVLLSVYAVQTTPRRLAQAVWLQTCNHASSYNPFWDINRTEILCSFL
jgi:hypothetical protein